jgi:DNA-binding PadR family transcriptional regulator
MASRRKVGNLLGLALLALLVPHPMHPYEMANVLRRTGKERDMKIKWGSLYTVVQNLEKHGFISAVGVDREGGRPERTIYAITEAGTAELKDWVRELIGEIEPELSHFEAALSVIAALAPDEAIELLTRRLGALDADVAAQQATLRDSAFVPRIFLIEGEYALAMRKAEADWVRSLLAEFTAGTVSGVQAWRQYAETGEVAPEFQQLLAEGGWTPD